MTTQPPACGKISEEMLTVMATRPLDCVPSTAEYQRMARELLSLRHPAPVADERAEAVRPWVKLLPDTCPKCSSHTFNTNTSGTWWRCMTCGEHSGELPAVYRALSARPSVALEREHKAGPVHVNESGGIFRSTRDVIFAPLSLSPPTERAPGGDALNDMNGKHAVDGISALLKDAEPLHRDAFEHLEPVPHIATLINNNQSGWTNIIETAPNVTIDVGTKLYDQKALFAVGVAMLEQGRKGGFEDGYISGKAYQKHFASGPPPSSSPSATADATSSVAIATLRAALEEAINLRVGLYRNHEDAGTFKPAAQVIAEDKWLSRWSAALTKAKP